MSVLELIPGKKKKAPAPKGLKLPALIVPRYAPEPIPSRHPVPPRLARKLEGLRKRWRWVRVAEWAALFVSAILLALALQMFLDWLIDLPFLVRALLLAADITLLVYSFRRWVLPLLKKPLGNVACALLVEKHWPRLRGRVIATVQFASPRVTPDSYALVNALQEETELSISSYNFDDIVTLRLFKRRAWVALGILVVWLGLMVALAPGSIQLLERVFLIPAKVPRKTDVICLSKDMVVPQGNSVVLEAQARGIIPSHGRITLKSSSGRIQEITIDRVKDQPDHFRLKLDRVDESLTYTIRINDGVAGPYDVKTVPRPNVTSIECEQVYPPYAGLGTVKRTVGNLALLAGSKLQIHAKTNSKIVKASMKLMGIEKTLPLTISGENGDDLRGEIEIPAADLTGFSIQLTNQAGITSGDETQYRIDLIPDRPPTIQITKPEALEILSTVKNDPNIAFVAGDDYGLAKVSLCYRIGAADNASATDSNGAPIPPPEPKRIEMDLGQGHPLNLQALYVFDLSAIKPPITEGTTIEYWMEAQDTNNVTGPGIGSSEHHVIKVVSEVEKKAEIMNRLLSGLSTLNDISSDEKKINQDLYRAIQGKPVEPPPAEPPKK